MIGSGLLKRITEVGTEPAVRGGAGALRKVDRSRLAEYLVRFALGFTLSGSQIFDGVAPFAVGFTATSGSVSGCIASLAGAACGYLLSGPLVWAVKYICICVIVTTATVIFKDTEVFRTDWFMPAIAAFVTASVDLVPVFTAGWRLPAIAMLLTDAVLAGAGAYFYKISLSPWSGRFNLEHSAEIVHTVSVLILISTLLLSLAQLKLFGAISVGRTMAVLIVFLAAYKGGVGMGCVAGLSIGLAMDAAANAAPIFCTAYGLAGMISGIFSKRSKLVFAVTYIFVDAVVAAVSLGMPASRQSCTRCL